MDMRINTPQPATTETQVPTDPMSVVAAGAVAMHVLYGSLCEAGFTQDEALTLIAKLCAEKDRNE